MATFVKKIIFEERKQIFCSIFGENSGQSEIFLDHDQLKLLLQWLAKFHVSTFFHGEQTIISDNVHQELETVVIKRANLVLQKLLELAEDFPEIKIDKNKILQLLEENLKGKSAPENILHKFKTTSCLGYIWGKYLLDDDSKTSKSSEEINLLNISPVYDVIIAIYCTTSNEYRKYNLECLLNYYYDSLKLEFETNNKCLNNYLEYHDYKRLTRQYISQVKILAALVKFQIIKEKGLCVENREILMDILKEFEENSKNDTSIILLEDIHLIVRKKCPKIKFNIRNFNFESIGKSSGYLGDHNKLTVNISTGDREQKLRYFIKILPKDSIFAEIISDSDLYAKEIIVYTEIAEEMRRQNIAIINECLPMCYLAIMDKFLVFEDLGETGFITPDHRRFLEVSEIETVIKTLAKFQASSLILEEKLGKNSGHKKTLEEFYARALKESYFVEDDRRPVRKSFNVSIKTLNHMIDKIFGENMDDFKRYSSSLYDKSVELLHNGENFRKILSHGDLWPTNFLLKYDDSGNPIDCRLIDFQLTRYAVPGHDFLFMVVFATSHEHRQKHLKHYIDLHYKELESILKCHGLQSELILSYDEFLKGCDYIFPQIVFQVASWYQMVQISPKKMSELNGGGGTNYDLLYNERRWYCEAAYEADEIYREKTNEGLNLMKIAFEVYRKYEPNEQIRYLKEIYKIQ